MNILSSILYGRLVRSCYRSLVWLSLHQIPLVLVYNILYIVYNYLHVRLYAHLVILHVSIYIVVTRDYLQKIKN